MHNLLERSPISQYFYKRYILPVMDPSEEEDVAQPKEEITDDEDVGDVTKKEVLGTEEKVDYERKLELLRVQLYHERRKVKEGEHADQVQKQELAVLTGRLESLETELGSLRLKVSYQDKFVQSLKDKTECPGQSCHYLYRFVTRGCRILFGC